MKNLPKKIIYKKQTILTSKQLAEFYNCDTKKISYNFNHNKSRYTEGKHYFTLQGADKKDFVNRLEIHDSGLRAKLLYLWTEKGAFLHAKSLNTDKAWEVYEFLIDKYYKEPTITIEQAAYLYKLIDMFKYITHQKIAARDHKDKWVENRKHSDSPIWQLCVFFNQYRNEELDINPKDIEERLIEYCLKERRKISLAKKPKFVKMFTMDNYETLRHAVWDFMHVKGKGQVAHKIANLAYSLAKKSEIDIEPLNEDNLFHYKTIPGLGIDKTNQLE